MQFPSVFFYIFIIMITHTAEYHVTLMQAPSKLYLKYKGKYTYVMALWIIKGDQKQGHFAR